MRLERDWVDDLLAAKAAPADVRAFIGERSFADRVKLLDKIRSTIESERETEMRQYLINTARTTHARLNRIAFGE